jgi:hypothetical protein
MLETLFGSVNKERIIFFIYAREEGYPREIARFFATGLTPIQRQLEALESGGILLSRLAGRTRLYMFNPRYPLLDELKALIEKAMAFYPEEERERLLIDRRRPRRKDKPL